jgi:hypothetical protein
MPVSCHDIGWRRLHVLIAVRDITRRVMFVGFPAVEEWKCLRYYTSVEQFYHPLHQYPVV